MIGEGRAQNQQVDAGDAVGSEQPLVLPLAFGEVEPAETIEDAVCREIREEAGIECADVQYYKAQPWPYPYSLMIGCTAKAKTTDINVDRNELEDARWFTREEVKQMMQDTHPDGQRGPNGIAIAHHLLGQWAFADR